MKLCFRNRCLCWLTEINPPLFGISFFLCLMLLGGCSIYGEKVAPIPLPSSTKGHVNIRNVILIAKFYLEKEQAKSAFGFDIRKAGLLPVKVVIDNQSASNVKINPKQTFLIDREEQAWPLLTAEQAYNRVSDSVEVGETFSAAAKPSVLMGAAGAVAGFAVGVLSGENIAEMAAKGAALGASAGAIYGGAARQQSLEGEIRKDLAQHSLRNLRVRSGDLAHGFLFFPGQQEATSARRLRLGIIIDGESVLVFLPVIVP